jgi:serine/threonine protein kinase
LESRLGDLKAEGSTTLVIPHRCIPCSQISYGEWAISDLISSSSSLTPLLNRSMLVYQPAERTNAVDSLKHPYLQSVDSQPEEKQDDGKTADDTKPGESGGAGSSQTGETKKGEEEETETKTLPTNSVAGATSSSSSADRRR